MAFIKGNAFTRSEVIRRLRQRGYPINSHDISWATRLGIIKPIPLKSNFFAYGEEDLIWLEQLGELKKKGVDKSIVEKIVDANAMDVVFSLCEKAQRSDK